MDILLVGEDEVFLRVLALELALMGATVRTVNDSDTLRRALEDACPEVVVLDHIEPADLFALNPRVCGYGGPLVVLIEHDVPQTTLESLEDPRILRKPLLPSSLLPQIRVFVTG